MKFRVQARWNDRQISRIVEADDACEAMDWARPGSYTIGEFDKAEITIYRVPDDTPFDD